MTDPPPSSEPKPPSFVQIPIELIKYVRSLKLTGTQYDLWLYLYELDPYGSKWVEVPPPSEIAQLLKVDVRTIQRCAQRLADCELFEFQIKRWKARNTTISAKVYDFSLGKEIHLRTKRSKSPQMDQKIQKSINTQEAKPLQDEVSRNGACTNNRFKESKETIGTPTANGQGEHLVQAQNPLMELVIGAGMHSNKTIQRILRELEQQLDPADAKRAVENAVSALQEQQAQGTVRNPGGFLVAALRGNFTANESKRNARKKQGDSQNGSTSTTLSPEKNNRYGFPESSPPADLSDVIAEISVHRNRLGWTKEQTIAYMVERHGWRKVAFSALTDADLIALSRELQSL